MKSLLIAAICIVASAASAAENDNPHALACMKKAGITYASWRSGHAGTQALVDRYVACRDSKKKCDWGCFGSPFQY
jgi:hypothetical protein